LNFTDGDLTAVRSAIGDEFASEIGQGFSLEGPVEHRSPLIEQQVEFVLANPLIDRAIRFTLLAHRGKNSINVFVERPSGGVFSLKQYFAVQQSSKDVSKKFELGSYGGSLQQRVILLIRQAKHVLSTELAGAVSGTEWPDVPIDWGQIR
jgi:hypothetical protein